MTVQGLPRTCHGDSCYIQELPQKRMFLGRKSCRWCCRPLLQRPRNFQPNNSQNKKGIGQCRSQSSREDRVYMTPDPLGSGTTLPCRSHKMTGFVDSGSSPSDTQCKKPCQPGLGTIPPRIGRRRLDPLGSGTNQECTQYMLMEMFDFQALGMFRLGNASKQIDQSDLDMSQ